MIIADVISCAVQEHLPWLLDTFHPDLVLYDAGVDPHREDELGRLRLTDQGEPYHTIIHMYDHNQSTDLSY